MDSQKYGGHGMNTKVSQVDFPADSFQELQPDRYHSVAVTKLVSWTPSTSAPGTPLDDYYVVAVRIDQFLDAILQTT